MFDYGETRDPKSSFTGDIFEGDGSGPLLRSVPSRALSGVLVSRGGKEEGLATWIRPCTVVAQWVGPVVREDRRGLTVRDGKEERSPSQRFRRRESGQRLDWGSGRRAPVGR